MRIASFNVENLFERAAALNRNEFTDNPADPQRISTGRAVLDAYAKLNTLFREAVYSPSDKAAMVQLMAQLGLERDDESPLVVLRRNRGALLRRPRAGGVEIIADGRDAWIGWLDLKREPVDEVATQNTARVLRDVGADLVVVVEAESRTSLSRFNAQLMPKVGGKPYAHVMLIDGNDARGIDVGLLTRSGIKLDFMRSHVDDMAGAEPVFSRDCPEYHLRLPNGERLAVLANHFKSKGHGAPAQSNARRRAQAARVREIYEGLRAGGIEHIAIAGDLNDTPDSAPLMPLLRDGSDLRDISAHGSFDDGGRPGTYANGTKGDKIDYLLLSPPLFGKATGGGIFRRGAWGGVHGTLWPHYDEMTSGAQAASDHAAIWAEFNI